MTIRRISQLDLPEGVFYGVVTLSDGNRVVYLIEDAANGAAALESLTAHAASDATLGLLTGGASPVTDVQLTI